MKITPLGAVLLAFICVPGGAAFPGLVVAAKPASLFEGKGVADAVAKVTRKMKAPVRVLKIEINPTGLTMQVQDPAAPTHIDEYRYTRLSGVLSWLASDAISGPKPVELNLINPRLEENLFNLDDVNISAVPETIAAALQRVRVEDGAVTSITIQRQLLLNQSGPVEWQIYVRGPRETASAAADAQGKIRRVDLSGTTRAKTLDLTQGGAPLTEAIAEIREQFGAGPVFKHLSINTKRVGFSIRDPENPAQAVAYAYEIEGIKKPLTIEPTARIDKVVESQLFSVDDVDWSRLPQLKDLAVEQVAIPNGHITNIEVSRPTTAVGHKPPHWKFTVSAGFFKKDGTAEFEARTGAVARVIPPEDQRKKINHLEPEMVNRMVATARAELGADIGFLTIFIADGGGTMSVHSPGHADEIRRYGFDDINGLHFLETTHDRRLKDPPETWRTPLPDVEAALPMLPALYQKARERLQLPQGVIQRLTLNRSSEFYPGNKAALLEIRIEVPGDSGWVVYDLTGAERDVVVPDGYKSDEQAAPKLKALGMTDATPKRVAKFDAHFASFLKHMEEYGDTPWYKTKETAPGGLSKLPRAEFRKFATVQCDALESVEQILKVFRERKPPSDEMASSEAAPHARRREFWENHRTVWDASCRQSKVLDKNWTEWMTHGMPEDEARYKPWQKEVARLNDEIAAAQKRVLELSPPQD